MTSVNSLATFFPRNPFPRQIILYTWVFIKPMPSRRSIPETTAQQVPSTTFAGTITVTYPCGIHTVCILRGVESGNSIPSTTACWKAFTEATTAYCGERRHPRSPDYGSV